jgi:hypothetical protein
MALFAIWQEGAAAADEAILAADAHIVPERVVSHRFETPFGTWRLWALSCATHFYKADAQIWVDGQGGFCVIHGLIWRTGSAALLDARDVAELLDAPGMRLPDDVAGEYAIARLHADGRLEAFGDPAGLHQLFHAEGGAPILASRAAFVATLVGQRRPDRDSALWLATIGYRIGLASGWVGVQQLDQGAVLIADASGMNITRHPLALPSARGFDPDLLAEGLEQAKAAIRLAAGDGPLDLPITGGKDSRVVLAIALAAGLKDRLTLFTRGYAQHPDVVVGAAIAERVGVPHRREPPLGSDQPADLEPAAFLARLGLIAFQTDGGMGGWDNVFGTGIGQETILSGHLGEVLKAYAKRQPEGRLDPVAMVRLQAPFDPMELVRPDSRHWLVAALGRQMTEARAAGAEEADLPDIFYWRNRVPNWLGGIRGVKSFERQPVLPLGVPALIALAFRMTAAERKMELAHYRLIEAAAPELIDLPFAHQSWHPALGASVVAPVLAAPDAPLFGNWQWSVNRVPAVRATLAAFFGSTEIPLWQDVDRARLIDALHQRRFDYFDLISLLGATVAAIHQAGTGVKTRLGDTATDDKVIDLPPAAVCGHVDLIDGMAIRQGDAIRLIGDGMVTIEGWMQAPDWPGATVAVEARADGHLVATATADRFRADLLQAGIGDGHHGFSLTFDAALLNGASVLTLGVPAGEGAPEGGILTIVRAG